MDDFLPEAQPLRAGFHDWQNDEDQQVRAFSNRLVRPTLRETRRRRFNLLFPVLLTQRIRQMRLNREREQVFAAEFANVLNVPQNVVGGWLA